MTGHSLVELLRLARAAVISGCFGGSLAALSLLRHPRESMYSIQYSLFGWQMIARAGLPMRQLHTLFPQLHGAVQVEVLPDTGFMERWDANYAKDMLYLALLARAISAKVVFEIGTLNGYTALLFALNTSPGATIYTLDLPGNGAQTPSLRTTLVDDRHISARRQEPRYLYEARPETGNKVEQLYGDSATFDFTRYRDRVDLFFIDGAHSYEYVRSDSERALSCVRPGGVIAWHDYGRWGVNGVSKWLHELAKSGRDVCRLPGSSVALLKL